MDNDESYLSLDALSYAIQAGFTIRVLAPTSNNQYVLQRSRDAKERFMNRRSLVAEGEWPDVARRFIDKLTESVTANFNVNLETKVPKLELRFYECACRYNADHSELGGLLAPHWISKAAVFGPHIRYVKRQSPIWTTVQTDLSEMWETSTVADSSGIGTLE